MKLTNTLIALGLSSALIGMAHAAPVNKTITLTAEINDAIFVSKPDGSTWYGTESLVADDFRQTHFTKTLPVRVWTKGTEFNVSLGHKLRLTGGGKEMKNVAVSLAHSSGEGAVEFGATPLKVTQVQPGDGGMDEIHDLKITADAPGGTNDNGTYSGDLVLVFEPVAAAGGGGGSGGGGSGGSGG